MPGTPGPCQHHTEKRDLLTLSWAEIPVGGRQSTKHTPKYVLAVVMTAVPTECGRGWTGPGQGASWRRRVWAGEHGPLTEEEPCGQRHQRRTQGCGGLERDSTLNVTTGFPQQVHVLLHPFGSRPAPRLSWAAYAFHETPLGLQIKSGGLRERPFSHTSQGSWPWWSHLQQTTGSHRCHLNNVQFTQPSAPGEGRGLGKTHISPLGKRLNRH